MAARTTLYQDPARIAAIIDALYGSGLGVDSPSDRDKAAHYLARIGEHRLLQYALPFRVDRRDGARFYPNVRIHNIRNLYKFDHRLRLEMLDALERVEISIKSDLHHELTRRYGDNWLLQPGFLDDFLYGEDRQNSEQFRKQNTATLASIRKDICRKPTAAERGLSDGDILKRRLDRNHSAVCSSMTFGSMSKLYGRLPIGLQDQIAGYYGLPGGHILAKLLWAFTAVRNAAAHHDRIWDIFLHTQIDFPVDVLTQLKSHQPPDKFERRLYGVSLALYLLLKRIARNTTWHERLRRTVTIGAEKVPTLRLPRLMAFPANWDKCAIWQWRTP